jgi:hypothetical protein
MADIRQEAIRAVDDGVDPLPMLREMVAQGRARHDPTLSIALSIEMVAALIDRADKAEAERVAAQDIAIGAQEAEGRAEAALAAERRQYGVSMKAMLERESAARADAKALAEALKMVHSAVHCSEPCDAVMHDDITAALAAYKEATE